MPIAEHNNSYLCPQNQVLSYSTTTREGYREYKSAPSTCRNCPLLSQCTTSKNTTRVIARHIWEDYREQINEHRYEHRGKALYKRRKETVERSFADAKELHKHRYATLRGLSKVREQCLLSAACQNIKKIALILGRKAHIAQQRLLNGLQELQIAFSRQLFVLITQHVAMRVVA